MSDRATDPLQACQDAWERFHEVNPEALPNCAFFTGYWLGLSYCTVRGMPLSATELLAMAAADILGGRS